MTILVIIGNDPANRLDLNLDTLAPNPDPNQNAFGMAFRPAGCVGGSTACKITRRYLVGVPVALTSGLQAFRVNDASVKPAELYVFQFMETTKSNVTTPSIDNAHAFVQSLDPSRLLNKLVFVMDDAFNDQSI